MIFFSPFVRQIFISIYWETLKFTGRVVFRFFCLALLCFDFIRLSPLCVSVLEAKVKCGAGGKFLEVGLSSKTGIWRCCSVLNGSRDTFGSCLPLFPDCPAGCVLWAPAVQWLFGGMPSPLQAVVTMRLLQLVALVVCKRMKDAELLWQTTS